MKHKQNLKLILLIVNIFLMCSKKDIDKGSANSQTIEAPAINKELYDTDYSLNNAPAFRKIKKSDNVVTNNNCTFSKSIKDSSATKKLPRSKFSKNQISLHRIQEAEKLKTLTIIKNKDTLPCSISFPDFYSSHERPVTIAEAAELSQCFWKKALCYKSINIDSCFSYTQKAIKTYENGSLFTLKAHCLYKMNMFTASKTAAEISLSRNDHWNLIDTKIALNIKIQVLDTINKTHPSFEIKSELEKSQYEYKNLYGNN